MLNLCLCVPQLEEKPITAGGEGPTTSNQIDNKVIINSSINQPIIDQSGHTNGETLVSQNSEKRLEAANVVYDLSVTGIDKPITNSTDIKSNHSTNKGNLFLDYQKNRIIALNTDLSNLRSQLQNYEQQFRHKIVHLKKLSETFDKVDDNPKYVAVVQKCLGRNQVKVKLGNDTLVMKYNEKLKETDLVANSKVAVHFASFGSLLVYKVLTSVDDPMLSLMIVQKDTKATYEMIGGLAQQIQEIKEVIELPIKHPEIFEALGISQPKGVLLHGPPGTGKTLLARAVAHHTDCMFFCLSGTDLVQKYIGEGARMVRELFLIARKKAPSIIFIDEIDSIGTTRSDDSGGASGISTTERTMIELLNQLDGFEPSQNIKIIMATNRIDTLDQALIRPGRIDRKIAFPAPNLEGRVDILKVHSRKMNLGRSVKLEEIAAAMAGASGAELKAVCQEAAMCALREGRSFVKHEDFMLKVEKVMCNFKSQALHNMVTK